MGCLIEARPVDLDGVTAVYQLVKMPRPASPDRPGAPARGLIYLATFTVARQLRFSTVQYMAQESEPTGMREAMLHARLSRSIDQSVPHPYDPELTSLLPFSWCDDQIYDPLFPDHPLSRVRAWAERAARTMKVDPEFASLPDFVPGDPAAAAYGYRPGVGGAGWEELQPLADRGQLYAALRNAQLHQLVEPLDRPTWHVDIAAKTFRISTDDPSQTIEAVPHLIANLHPSIGEVWPGWSHGDADSEVSWQMYEYGDAHDLPVLGARTVPYPPIDGDPDRWTASTAHQLGRSAVEITGHAPYYVGRSADGAVSVLLLDVDLPPLTVPAAMTVMPQVLAKEPPHDGPAAVDGLVRLAGWTSFEHPELSPRTMTVGDGVNRAVFTFDEHERLDRAVPALARTPAEGFLYMERRPCECGSTRFEWESLLINRNGVFQRHYFGPCQGCKRQREFLFRLPELPDPLPADGHIDYGRGRSELLDPGEWYLAAALAVRDVPDRPPEDVEERRRATLELARVCAAFTQMRAFVDPETGRIPQFWLGMPLAETMLEAHPEIVQVVEIDRLLKMYGSQRDWFGRRTDG